MSPHQGRHQGDRGGGGRVLGALGLGGKTTSPALETVGPHHLLDHPGPQTLLEPAELTPVPPSLVHRTALVRQTDVLGVLLDGPLEEALAALAGADPVVLTGGVVTADGALQGSVSSVGCADSGGTGN